MPQLDAPDPLGSVTDSQAARSLTWRYVVALALVASLSTAAWLSLYWVISEQQSTAALVNVSGRQRMLSQRTALFGQLLVNAPVDQRPVLRQRLKESIALFERSHAGLTQGDADLGLPAQRSPAVRSLYEDGPNSIDTQVTAFVAAANTLWQLGDEALRPDNPQLGYVTAAAASQLLTSLNAMVDLYQREGEARVAQLQRAETLFWLLTLALLGLEAALIFRPFVKQIQSTIAKLHEAHRQLRQDGEALEQQVQQRTRELQQRSNALAESEEKFRLISAAAQDAIVIIDAQDRLVYWNPAAEAMFGYQQNDLAGVAFHSMLVPPELRGSASSGMAEFKRSGAGAVVGKRFEAMAVRHTGEVFPIELAVSSVWLQEGWHGIGIVRDITDRKRMDTELKIAATAFESQMGMFISDARQNILRVNRAFCRITGYTPQEVIGRNPRLLSSGRHDQGFYADMFHSIACSDSWQGEIWNRHKDGEVYPEWLTITAVKNDAGELTHFVAAFSDISERKAAENQIRHLAYYDPLTQLPNRRLLMDRLEQALAACTRHRQLGALLFIDLDNFKGINDALGYSFGDLLLKQVAQRLLNSVHSSGTVARLGSDEFVVMLEALGHSDAAAARQAEHVGRMVFFALGEPYLLENRTITSTPSIGIALFSEQRQDLQDLLKRADLAMSQAKAAGRNTLCFFDPHMQAQIDASSALEADLQQALKLQQFALYYQMQVTADGKIVGAEVLLRWQHPGRGMVSPAEFIPMAEKNRLILPIGAWVLEAACDQIRQWSGDPTLSQLTLAVNVSAVQFRQPDYVDQVLATLSRTGIRAQRLKLELTESLLLDKVEDVITKMKALKAVGVAFSLDDFGTGYSSLTYLQRLPLEQIKIDQSFVRDIESSDSAVAICAASIGLGHSLAMKVVAEGVETEAQRYFLTAVHPCDFMQGYLFGKPVPLSEFEDQVHRSVHVNSE